MADRVGQQLGNYRLVRLIGQGGFAEVYLGEHIHLGTQAAIKVLLARLSSEDIEKFRTEARTIARLSHAHIVRVLDFEVEDGTAFLVMDYAPNGTLRQRHPPGMPLAPLVIAPYVKQIADALQYAHEQKVIHRDIKPENMLLGAKNEVLLSDFGIALVAQGSRYETNKDVAGTVAYMAPEQIQGQPVPASDQYALGIVVYEWLTGARPFQGSYQQVALQQQQAAPLSMRVRVPGIAQPVEEVVMIALAKHPKERFGSIRAFATAFQEASLADQTTLLITPDKTLAAPALHAPGTPQPPIYPVATPTPPPLVTPAAPWLPTPQPGAPPGNAWGGTPPGGLPVNPWAAPSASGPATPNAYLIGQAAPVAPPTAPPIKSGVSRRSVLIGGVIGGLAGLAAVGGGVFFWVRSGSSPFSSGASPTATAPVGSNNTPASTPFPQPTPIYTYRGHNANVLAVTWSPDGQRIASASFDQTVQVWDALTGSNVYVYRGHTDQVEAVAWSPDGRLIASGGKDNTVRVWDAVSGADSQIYTGHSGHVVGIAWSPDSTRIASASYDGTARVWSVSGGDTLQKWMGHTGRVQCVAWSPDGQSIATGGYDYTVQLWKPDEGNGLYIYKGHADVVESVAWSPDSKRIVSGSNDQTAQVWDARDGRNGFTYFGHSSYVYSVAWSPDGRRIASGSYDQTAQVWDASNGANHIVYRGHSSVVESVAWSRDNRHIASGSDDQTVQVWTF